MTAMPLTKNFKETVRARLIRSAGFRKAVLQEALDSLLAGDVNTGKALLRDYINGTMGFERLGALTHIPAKSLMRMLGPKGNPRLGTCSTSSATCSAPKACTSRCH
jgi:hypothetical protein